MFKVNFSYLERMIKYCEEKQFYDIVKIYLNAHGYFNAEIRDGRGDGGKDIIIPNNKNLNIQLSIQQNWKNKLNKEAETILKDPLISNKSFWYITNKSISQSDIDNFRANEFKYKGQVEFEVKDVKSIASMILNSNYLNQIYELLGIPYENKIKANLKEIALSSVLLYSSESRELKNELLESFIKMTIFQSPSYVCKVDDLISRIIESKLLPPNVENFIKSKIDKLKIDKKLSFNKDTQLLSLSNEEFDICKKINQNLNINKDYDFKLIKENTHLSDEQVNKILNNIDFSEDLSNYYESLFTKENISNDDIKSLSQLIPKLKSIQLKIYSNTIYKVLTTNSFDIYRALGRHTSIKVLLDSNVAMPILFGLLFQEYLNNRYSNGAKALLDFCKIHNLEIIIPDIYIEEIESNGRLALSQQENIKEFEQAQNISYLINDRNAFIHQFANLVSQLPKDKLSFSDFLSNFGIGNNTSKKHAQLFIKQTFENLLIDFGVNVQIPKISKCNFDEEDLNQLRESKPHDAEITLKHDAQVCYWVKNDADSGYIVATWNKSFMKVLEENEKIGIYADTPSRIRDFLSFINEENHDESIISYELLAELSQFSNGRINSLSESLTNKILSLSTEKVSLINKIINNAKQDKQINLQDLEEQINEFIDISDESELNQS